MYGNVGPPSSGGHLTAEPLGVIDVDILHEQLKIDLRPLANNKPALVEAIYDLKNDADEKVLELVFVSGANRIGEFTVMLNEDSLPSRREDQMLLPDSWKAPATNARS